MVNACLTGKSPGHVLAPDQLKSSADSSFLSYLFFLLHFLPLPLFRFCDNSRSSVEQDYEMKFGSQLRDAIYPEWRSYYIDYDGLKKKLRKAEKDRPFTEKDETEFVEVLDNNLEKVRLVFRYCTLCCRW